MESSSIMAATITAAGLFAVAVVTLILDLWTRDRVHVDRRFREELGDWMRQRERISPLFRDLSQSAAAKVPTLVRIVQKTQVFLEQAGLSVSVGTFVTIALLLAATASGLTLLASRSWLLTAIAASLAAPAPYAWAAAARRGRLQTFRRQLPEAFEFMARALRAGQSLTSSFQVVSQSFRAPLSDEFARCYEQQNLGIPVDVALRGLARRIDVMELQIFVVALIVQRRSGGNLADLLSKLAGMMRKRLALRDRVAALTGEGRMQARVLIALPPLAFAAIWFVNPHHTQVLLDHAWLLYAALLSQAIGAAAIWKIVNFEY
jgi:tight adherence protein B